MAIPRDVPYLVDVADLQKAYDDLTWNIETFKNSMISDVSIWRARRRIVSRHMYAERKRLEKLARKGK